MSDKLGAPPLPGDTGLDFGEALRALKLGYRVSRKGWHGNDMWLAYSPGAKALGASAFWGEANRNYAEDRGGYATVLPSITIKLATGEIMSGWLPSQADMLTEDWEVLQ